jgi:two-component system nitrate/nitrite response regulator NarP
MCTIVIADDHEFLRNGLQSVLENMGHDVVAAVGNGEEALVAIDREDPDLAILDVRMPMLDGVGVLERMRAGGDSRPVILLTAELEDSKLASAMKAGVDGVVFKSAPAGDLDHAITRTLAGEQAVDGALIEKAESFRNQPSASFGELSPREMQIATAVAAGQRNKEIATIVGMTEGSVKVYLHKIYEKTGVQNRTELAIRIMSFADKAVIS